MLWKNVSRWLGRLVFIGCCLAGCLGGILPQTGCQPGCATLSEAYALTGCLGEDTCNTVQTDCQIRFDCQTAFQYCQGFMVGREINMRCATNDGHSFQAIIDLRETFLQMTVVKTDGTCQSKLTGK